MLEDKRITFKVLGGGSDCHIEDSWRAMAAQRLWALYGLVRHPLLGVKAPWPSNFDYRAQIRLRRLLRQRSGSCTV